MERTRGGHPRLQIRHEGRGEAGRYHHDWHQPKLSGSELWLSAQNQLYRCSTGTGDTGPKMTVVEIRVVKEKHHAKEEFDEHRAIYCISPRRYDFDNCAPSLRRRQQ